MPWRLCLCHKRSVLLKPPPCKSPTIQGYSCNSTQEHLAVHGWRKYQEHNPHPLWKKRSPSSPGTVGVLHSSCSAHSIFSPKTFSEQTVSISAKYLHIQSYARLFHAVIKVKLWQYPYFKEFRYPEAVNSMLLLWFFRYIPQTSSNEQAEMNQIVVGKK